jgi:hypothetical protein
VAHELFHSVNVYHHGESDRIVAWGVDDTGEVAEFDGTSESQISVYYEPDRDVTASWRDKLSKPPYDETPALGWLGYEGGQHSGDDQCVMRYFNADAYIGNPDAARRYWTQEKPGSSLCRSATGSGVNDSARAPQSRFGDASTGRGDCQHQLLVNDAVTPPGR